jgi:hypothetical protein
MLLDDLNAEFGVSAEKTISVSSELLPSFGNDLTVQRLDA